VCKTHKNLPRFCVVGKLGLVAVTSFANVGSLLALGFALIASWSRQLILKLAHVEDVFYAFAAWLYSFVINTISINGRKK
jgi:hypothetical protein